MSKGHTPNLLTLSRHNDRATPPCLSVCVSLKNRSRVCHNNKFLLLFPDFVRSLAKAAVNARSLGNFELVVADFYSDDWPLVDWIEQASHPLQLQVVSVEGPFSRGKGLNLAARHARSERLFLCDSDILLHASVLRRAVEIVDEDKAWLPVFRCLDEQGRPDFWQDASYGLAALGKPAFERTGGVPEFNSWGGEDDIFRDRAAQCVELVRERVAGLNHQWHPDSTRHEHYTNESGADYTAFMASAGDQHNSNVLCVLHGKHPHWEGEIHLYSGVRMCRPGVDEGDYEYEPRRRILLKWDRWPPEELYWDSDQAVYREVGSEFTLRPLNNSDT